MVRQHLSQTIERFRTSQELRKVASNSAWLFSDKVLRLAANLIVGVWIARYLGPDQFGLLNYAIAFVALFAPIASLGLDNVVVRELVRNPEDRSEILGTTASMTMVSGILVSILALVTVEILRPNDRSAMALIAIVAITNLFLPANVVDFWFQSKVQSKLSVLARNSAFFIAAALRILLIVTAASLIAFAWAYATEVMLAAIGLIVIFVWQGGHLGQWRFSSARARTLLKDSWPLILSGLSVLLFVRLDQIMLAQISDFHEVGIYAAAVRFIEVFAFVPAVVLMSIYPQMVRIREQDAEAYYRYCTNLFRLFLFASVCLAIAISLFAMTLMTPVLGPEYSESSIPLVILAWGFVATFAGSVRAQILFIDNINIYHVYSALVGILCLIPLNLILIPLYGAMGAAVATLLSYYASAIGTSFLFPKLRYIGNMQIRAAIPKYQI